MQNTPIHPSPDVSRATRGRFLARHKARVIEQDDLVIVEFVEQDPWYTGGAAATNRGLFGNGSPLPRVLTVLLVMATSSASALYGVGKWLHWI